VLFEFTFPANEKTPRLARRALDGQLAYLGPDAEARMRLALSEVVTNAVRHGHLHPDEQIQVAIDLNDARARVEVRQRTPAAADVDRARDDDGGFGLQLVEELTDAWGTEPGPPGVVWFEIDARAAREDAR